MARDRGRMEPLTVFRWEKTMNWQIVIGIVKAIIEALEECGYEDPEEIHKLAQQPSEFQEWFVARQARRETLRSKDFPNRREARQYWRENQEVIVGEFWSKIKSASAAEIAYEMAHITD